ncbi:MAG: HAMP domain-containing sensor histidine kinase [Pirellulaceae bacterium]
MDCRICLNSGFFVNVDAGLLASAVANADSCSSVTDLLGDLETIFCLDGRMLVAVLDLFRQDSGSPACTYSQLMNWLATHVESWRVVLGQKLRDCEFLLAGQSPNKIRISLRGSSQKIFRQVSAAAFPDLKRTNGERALTKLAKNSFWRSFSFRLQSADATRTFVSMNRNKTAVTSLVATTVEQQVCESAPVESGPQELINLVDRLQTMKLRSMRWLAYGASHEINNPLANITIRAETLARTEMDPERRKKLIAIQQQALRAHQMISDLMLIAQPPKMDPSPTALKSVVEQVLQELSDRLQEAKVAVRLDLGDCPSVALDGKQIAEMIRALLQNAIQSIGSEGIVQIQTQAASDGQCLIIEDNGIGIPDDILPAIFDPFFSGREAGRGLGFGLTKAWRIAQDHGGTLTCLSSKPGATRFQFKLPVAGSATMADSRAA